jgi:hypothetical protein
MLPVLAVAFAAFCIWLTVRIVNRWERWAKWALTAALGVPMLYVLSFGPACRLVENQMLRVRPASVLYDPLVRIADPDLGAMNDWLYKYLEFCGGYWGCYEMLVERDIVRPRTSRSF